MRIPLVGPAGALSALAAAASECINLYAEAIEDPDDRAKNIGIFRGIPGAHLFATMATANVRGLWSGGGRLFVVSGAVLYEVNSSAAVVSSHTLGANDGNPVQMFGNGNQLGIVANGLFYYDNGAGPVGATFTGGSDPVTAVTGAYLDGSMFVQRPSGGSPDLGRQINFSDVNDFTTWRGLNFFSKESNPDYIQSILSDREQLYVFGAESSEVWQNDPTTGLPARLAAAREGSVARWAPVSLAQTVFFLGGGVRGQTIAYKLRGFTPVRISTHAVEQAWASTGSFAAQATSYGYVSGGHQFWVVNFTNPTNTWVYDETASEQFGYPVWHQRSRWNAGGSYHDTYPFWFHTFIPEWGSAGKHIVGHYNSGKLYELNDGFFDDEGADIAWRRAIPYRYNGGRRIYFGRQDLEMETGTVASGAEPTITRDYSDDRGNTFTGSETAGVGTHGDGTRRVYWPVGGSSNGRVWRYAGKGQSKVTLIDLQAEETAGSV